MENIVRFPKAAQINNEAESVRLAKSGDCAVWTLWHDTYYPILYRYAYVRLGNGTDAEDVASQVFLEALEGIDRYLYRGQPILAWFYGIARHLVSRRFRQRGRTAPLDGDFDDGLSSFELASEERIAIYAALDRLKPEHADVLTLRYLLDLPTKQVAELIGKTEQATYSLQVRALTAIRRLLDSEARQAA